jgi:hypothetical protein
MHRLWQAFCSRVLRGHFGGQIMAGTYFQSYDRNMRRQFWMNLVDYQVEQIRRETFRASIVSNPISGLPLEFGPPLRRETHEGR